MPKPFVDYIVLWTIPPHERPYEIRVGAHDCAIKDMVLVGKTWPDIPSLTTPGGPSLATTVADIEDALRLHGFAIAGLWEYEVEYCFAPVESFTPVNRLAQKVSAE